MSAINCPCDGDFCQKKQMHFEAWEKVIIKNDGMAFQISPHMFEGCPIESVEERIKICERYKRYLFVIENIQKEYIKENHK